MKSNENLKDSILKIFAKNPFDAFNHKQIAARLGIGSKAERQEVIRTLRQLAEEGMLLDDDHRGRLRANPDRIEALLPKSYVEGTMDMKQGGKAYVIPAEEGAEDI